MMTPEDQLDALILRYLDGALDENARRELETRLRDGAVAERLAVLASDQMELRRLLKSTAVAEDVARFARAPGKQFPARLSKTQARKRRWVAIGALAAATVLLVAAMFWAFRPGLRLEEGLVSVAGVETSRLREGERFSVVGDRPAVLRLGDGSRVQLEVGSEGVAHGRANGTRQLFELKHGAGRFKVEKGMGIFRVETPSGKVTVLGTEFDVKLQPGASKGEDNMNGKAALTLVVAVVVGSVQVDWSGDSVKLSAGQKQAFAAEGRDLAEDGRTGKSVAERAGDAEAKQGEKMAIMGVPKELNDKVLVESFDGKTYEVLNQAGDPAREITEVPNIVFLEATLVKKEQNGITVQVDRHGFSGSPWTEATRKLAAQYRYDEKKKAMGVMTIVAVPRFKGPKLILDSLDGKSYEVVLTESARGIARLDKGPLYLEVTLAKKQEDGGTVKLGMFGDSPMNEEAEQLEVKYLNEIIALKEAAGQPFLDIYRERVLERVRKAGEAKAGEEKAGEHKKEGRAE
jgi:ferric-dicitrate binding protein FerR (iron transport regulator)